MGSKVDRQVKSLLTFLKREGIGYEKVHTAQTGSVYITICWEPTWQDSSVTIRVADHSDAYGRSHYTVDGLEGTLAGAKAWIKENLAHHIDHEWAEDQGWR